MVGAKVESAVATETRKRLAEEQDLAAFCGPGYGAVVPTVMATVPGRPGRDDDPLEARDGFGHVRDGETIGRFGKRPVEQFPVFGLRDALRTSVPGPVAPVA